MAFIDQMRAGLRGGSICQVCATRACRCARTYGRGRRAAGRRRTSATRCEQRALDARVGRTGGDAESLYGRRKMTRCCATRAAVATARWTGSCASWACRACGGPRPHAPRSRARTAHAPATCWTATSPRQRQPGLDCRLHLRARLDRHGLRRLRGGRLCPAHRGLARDEHPPAELVLLPLRMAAWARGQQGHPSSGASWSITPMPGRSISPSGSPSTCSLRGSRLGRLGR